MGGISLVLDDDMNVLTKVTPETAVLVRPDQTED
jgi:hypothetical protein